MPSNSTGTKCGSCKRTGLCKWTGQASETTFPPKTFWQFCPNRQFLPTQRLSSTITARWKNWRPTFNKPFAKARRLHARQLSTTYSTEKAWRFTSFLLPKFCFFNCKVVAQIFKPHFKQANATFKFPKLFAQNCRRTKEFLFANKVDFQRFCSTFNYKNANSFEQSYQCKGKFFFAVLSNCQLIALQSKNPLHFCSNVLARQFFLFLVAFSMCKTVDINVE